MAIKAEPGPTGIATENCLNDGKSRESHHFDLLSVTRWKTPSQPT